MGVIAKCKLKKIQLYFLALKRSLQPPQTTVITIMIILTTSQQTLQQRQAQSLLRLRRDTLATAASGNVIIGWNAMCHIRHLTDASVYEDIIYEIIYIWEYRLCNYCQVNFASETIVKVPCAQNACTSSLKYYVVTGVVKIRSAIYMQVHVERCLLLILIS